MILLLIYTDENGIIGKIRASLVIESILDQVYLGLNIQYTVFEGGL